MAQTDMMQPLAQTACERRRVYTVVGVVFAVLVALSSDLLAAGRTQEADQDRIEGIVESVKTPQMVLVRMRDRLVTVDLTALGGVTVAVTPGQKIVAVGTMEASGDILHAKRLESPTSP